MKGQRRKELTALPNEPPTTKKTKYAADTNAVATKLPGSDQLPITRYRQQIVELVRNNQVVVITGETGSGKTTQAPQYLLGAGFNSICVSQPRRISAITLAKRVAIELSCDIGQEVGYSVRFE